MFIRLWHIYYDGFSHLPKWGKILIGNSCGQTIVLLWYLNSAHAELSQYDLYDGTGKK